MTSAAPQAEDVDRACDGPRAREVFSMVPPATSEVFDLQRLVPDLVRPTDAVEQRMLDFHLTRYRFAGRFCRESDVLDIACGVGYGAALLRSHGALTVLGVDISEDAIAYARSRYTRAGVSFQRDDAFRFEPGRTFSAVVSLGTIEHLDDPTTFVRRARSWLEPGGRFIASVPTTLTTDLNPYQRHDFSQSSFERMLKDSGFTISDRMHQVSPVSPVELLQNPRSYGVRENLVTYYASHPGKLLRRVASTLANGFSTRHLVVAARAV